MLEKDTWRAVLVVSATAQGLIGFVCVSFVVAFDFFFFVFCVFGHFGWLLSLCLEEPIGVLLWFGANVVIPVLCLFGCRNFVKAL